MPSSSKQLRGGVKEGAAKEGKFGGKVDNRADWNEARNWFFVTILKEYNSPKYRGQNGWTKEAWNSMTQRINEKFPSANFVVQKLKDREQRLKKEYNAVKEIFSKSGFGWDNNLKMATTIDRLWSELPQNLKKWQNKSFPYYDDLHEIYNGKIAEGKRCRRSSEKAKITDNKIQEEDYEQMSPLSPAMPVMQDSFIDLLPNNIDLNTEGGLNFDIHDSQYRAMAEEQATRESQCYSQTQDDIVGNQQNLKRKFSVAACASTVTPVRQEREKKKNKRTDNATSELIALRKQELEAYKDLTERQLQLKNKQIEQTNPTNDAYSMAKCMEKLKTLFLPQTELLKAINFLKGDRELERFLCAAMRSHLQMLTSRGQFSTNTRLGHLVEIGNLKYFSGAGQLEL